jgi:hypothetical protein
MTIIAREKNAMNGWTDPGGTNPCSDNALSAGPSIQTHDTIKKLIWNKLKLSMLEV